jgi:hypothetical protein
MIKNGQIYIQTIKFESERINQEVTPRYRPLAPAMDGSTGAIYQEVAPRPALTWTLPPAPVSLKP